MRTLAQYDAELAADVVAFKMGYEAAHDALELELTTFQWDVNYWYLRATDPEAHKQLIAGILADHAQGVAKSRQRERWAELDRIEKERQAELDSQAVRRG